MKKFHKRKNSKVETIRGNLAEVFGIHNVFLMGKTNKPFCKVYNLLRSFKIRTFKIKYWSRINTKLFYLQDKKRLGGKRTDKHKENVKKSFTMERIQRRKPFEEIHTVACIIVRRLLISVHKWQFPGMADTHEYWSQHYAHLVYLPIFHGLNLIIFS